MELAAAAIAAAQGAGTRIVAGLGIEGTEQDLNAQLGYQGDVLTGNEGIDSCGGQHSAVTPFDT